jgi:predicted O-methyltransferase YrrM
MTEQNKDLNPAKETNWFQSENDFHYYLNQYAGVPNINFLEIGSFNGISAKYMLENILTHPTSKLTCIDPWKGETFFNDKKIYFSDVEKEFDQNTSQFKKQLIKVKSDSAPWLAVNRDAKYDFIYIDGDHMPQAVMLDLLLSFKLLKPGGIMGIDDYGWGNSDSQAWLAYYSQSHSAIAVDWFLQLYKDSLQILAKGSKVWIRKHYNHRRYNEIYE